METITDIYSAVSRWCEGRFILRASYYTGRGVNLGDLNDGYLEMIYQGLKKEVGQYAATNFVKFVRNLNDLTASGFIQSFELFWRSGCSITTTPFTAGIGNQLSGRGDERWGEGVAIIAAVLGGKLPTPQEIEADSWQVKTPFIVRHQNELN